MGFADFLGPVGSLISGFMNNDAAEDRQYAAQDFSAQQYRTRYQTTVEDMRAAGLNPGLAYGGISGTPPTSSAASSAGTPDLGASYNQTRMTTAQNEVQNEQVNNIRADTANKVSSSNLIDAQAAQAWSTAALNAANLPAVAETVNKLKAEIVNLQATTANTHSLTDKIKTETEMLGVMMHKLTEEAELAYQRGLTEAQVRSQIQTTIQKLKSETNLNISNDTLRRYEIEAAKNLNNLGRNAKEAKPIFDIIKGILTSRSSK